MKIENANKKGRVIKKNLGVQSTVSDEQIRSSNVNFEQVIESIQFKTLLSNKKKFIVPWTVFFLVFLFYIAYFDFVYKCFEHACNR